MAHIKRLEERILAKQSKNAIFVFFIEIYYNVPVIDDLYEFKRRIISWCKNNFSEDRFYIHNPSTISSILKISFKHEEDAIAFKLYWS